MTMKRRNQTICAVLLSTLLIGIPVQAEIPEDALSDYMGDWYVNYMVEEGTQLNMAGLLGYRGRGKRGDGRQLDVCRRSDRTEDG